METDDEMALRVANALDTDAGPAMSFEQFYVAFARRLRDEWQKQAEPDILDSLDWNRLMSGERRALKPEHQEWFDRLYASPPTAPGMVSVPRDLLTKLRGYAGMVRSNDVPGDQPIYGILEDVDVLLAAAKFASVEQSVEEGAVAWRCRSLKTQEDVYVSHKPGGQWEGIYDITPLYVALRPKESAATQVPAQGSSPEPRGIPHSPPAPAADPQGPT